MNQIKNKMEGLSKHPHITNIMYLPALLLFTVFIIYPFLEGIRIAFTNWNGFSQDYDYVGFKNIQYLIRDKNMYLASKNTLIYGFGSTFIQQIIGLLYALLLNRIVFGRTFARTFIYLPVLIAPVIMGYMWYFIFQYRYGALNDILLLMGMEPVDWLAKGSRAVWLIVFVNSIQFCGISMVIYLAGLQTIPNMYYEAGQIDGTTAFQQFRHITMPLLKPSFLTSITLNLIGGLKLFDVIKALTNGGPGYASHSLSSLIDYSYFRSQSAGYSATMGILLFLMILLFTLIIQKISNSREVSL